MSNIYINEPPTSGKVLLSTSVGDIDIELWSKEAPKACRNFIQLCLEGFYNETIFHRVVKGFIVQGGDPTGTGLGGESIYGEPFKDEFHSRLRFERRGLVAMANAGKDDNLSQFFFTMAPAPELQNKHTIFGKVTGSTVYNMLKLQEAVVDHNERPEYPHKILSAEVLRNPFDDMIARPSVRHQPDKTDKDSKTKSTSKSRATKDFKLLSFGDEAEEEEEEVDLIVRQDLKDQSKSSHDLIKNDPKLSTKSAGDLYPSNDNKRTGNSTTDKPSRSNGDSSSLSKNTDSVTQATLVVNSDEESSDDLNDMFLVEKKKMEEARKQLKALKKELKSDRQVKLQIKQDAATARQVRDEKRQEMKDLLGPHQSVAKFVRKDAESREQESIEMLKRFQNKLKTVKTGRTNEAEVLAAVTNAEPAEDGQDEKWLAHRLIAQPDEDKLVLAKDANLKDNDWYDIYDPRSKLTKQRRETDAKETALQRKRKKH